MVDLDKLEDRMRERFLMSEELAPVFEELRMLRKVYTGLMVQLGFTRQEAEARLKVLEFVTRGLAEARAGNHAS